MAFDLNYSVSIEDGLKAYDDLAAKIAKNISGRGFTGIPTPSHQGLIPSDVTRLTDDQLGALLSQISEWSSYVEQQLADAEINLSIAVEQFEFIAAKLRITDQVRIDENGKKRTSEERNDLVRCDVRYINAKNAMLYWEATTKMIGAISKAADSNWNTVSRRITQRQQELERDRRGQNVNMTRPMFTR